MNIGCYPKDVYMKTVIADAEGAGATDSKQLDQKLINRFCSVFWKIYRESK